jgi:hypothetical protein
VRSSTCDADAENGARAALTLIEVVGKFDVGAARADLKAVKAMLAELG